MEPLADPSRYESEPESSLAGGDPNGALGPAAAGPQRDAPLPDDGPACNAAESSAAHSADSAVTSQDASPTPQPAPRTASASQIMAAFTDGSDVTLDAALEEAMAGLTEADVSGAAADAAPPAELAKGAVVTGRIANIGSEDVLIDFGAKALGVMPLPEFEVDEAYAVGDSLQVMVIGEDRRSGLLQVSRRQARQAAFLGSLKVGAVVEGRVTGMNKGGLEIVIEGLRGFIPASQVDLFFLKDISSLIGETVRVEVTKFELDDGTPNIVVSRRRWLMREEADRREKLLASLEVGQVRRGKVRSLTDYGAFVDLGGVDGLLHVRDMSWGRIIKPEDVVRVDDEIDVKIIKISQDKNDKKRISLSLKQAITNPWLNVAEKYQAGSTLQGRVVRLADFGAFVELEPGVDGLLPISEMSWTKRVRHPSDVVKEGDVVEVSVLTVDAEKHRVSLSLKALSQDPWTMAAERYSPGSTIAGQVVRTTEFGAFVEIEEGIDGLVHISELSDERVRAVTDKVRAGDMVEVRVLAVDPQAQRISLSMRRPPAEPSPEELAKAEAEHRRAQEAARKKAAKPRRGGLTFGWDQGLGKLDPSKFAR